MTTPTASDLAGLAYPDDPERIEAGTYDVNPFDTARQVTGHLLAHNDPPRLFAMGEAAVLLRPDGSLLSLDKNHGAGWLAYTAGRADFKGKRSNATITVDPPAAVMKIIPTLTVPQLPPLDMVTATPFVDAAGNVVSQDGYHPPTRLYLRGGGLSMPAVPSVPSGAQVKAALKLLVAEWLGDFPFAGRADKCNAIAMVLTLTGRNLFPLVPLLVVDASASGAGKNLLLGTACQIATGGPLRVETWPDGPAEQKKMLTSIYLEGRQLVVWDEMHVISGRALAAALTAEIYSDRVLGASTMMSAVNRLTQFSLGNNTEARGDMKRRVVPCRLVPAEENPGGRTGFRHPDLPGWVADHRGELLAATLTLWQNWAARGQPKAVGAMGSFNRWAGAVGGALEAAGLKGSNGFRSNTGLWLSYSDDEGGWAEHLASLRKYFGEEWFTAGNAGGAVVLNKVSRPPGKWERGEADCAEDAARKLGYLWRKQRETRHGGLYLARSDERASSAGSYTWAVRTALSPAPSGASPSSPVAFPQVRTGLLECWRSGDTFRPYTHARMRYNTHTSPVCPVNGYKSWSAALEMRTGDTGDSLPAPGIYSSSP